MSVERITPERLRDAAAEVGGASDLGLVVNRHAVVNDMRRAADTIEDLTRALNEKVQHHIDAHGGCGDYVMSSERKNALYDRDRRLADEAR